MSEELAHVLRRTTMAAHPDRMRRFEGSSVAETVQTVLDEVDLDDKGRGKAPWSGSDVPGRGDDDKWGSVSVWWINRLSSADSGLTDRMAWLWHNWFTTHDEAYDGQRLSADQLEIFYRYGLSDLRTLTHRVVTSGAMLRYLDAADSEAYNPNENLARELMELYTIGPGNYTEDDVRAAARALAGWKVDDETGTVSFDESAAFIAPLLYLDQQDDWNTQKVVDALVDHPATHQRVVGFIWYELVGVVATESQVEDLARTLKDSELRLLPVIRRILESDDFAENVRTRYASTVEWLVGARAAIDPDGKEELEPWNLNNLGQRPFAPPTPAGWPSGEYWTRPGSLLPRLQFTREVDTPLVKNTNWTTARLLKAAGLPAQDSVAPLIESILTGDEFDRQDRHRLAWRLALTCPTFQLT